MYVSPKNRFAENKDDFALHNQLTATSPFQRACDAALLQMIHDTKPSDDPSKAIAGFHRIMGAVEYQRHLLTLTEKPTSKPPPQSLNLNHQALA